MVDKLSYINSLGILLAKGGYSLAASRQILFLSDRFWIGKDVFLFPQLLLKTVVSSSLKSIPLDNKCDPVKELSHRVDWLLWR